VGTQYRPGIFYHNDEQKRLAEKSREVLKESGRFDKVAVEVTEVSTFYPAEEYHQDFYEKEPDHYYRYRNGCGRDRRLDDLWSDFTERIVSE
jgi:peptide-methionine (S)-S-oxide reductase